MFKLYIQLGQQDNLESKMNQDADQNSVTDSHSSSSDVIDSNDAKNATKTDILKINSEGASQQTINNEHIAKNHSIGDIKCTQEKHHQKNQRIQEKKCQNKTSDTKIPAFKGKLIGKMMHLQVNNLNALSVCLIHKCF